MHGLACVFASLVLTTGLCVAQERAAPAEPAALESPSSAATVQSSTPPATPPPTPASTPGLTGSISPIGRPKTDTGPTAEFRVYGLHALSSDLDNGGDVSLTRVGANLGVDIPISDRRSLGFEFGVRTDLYDFGADSLTPPTLPPFAADDPWESIYTYEVGVSWRDQIDEQWGYNVGLFASSSGESDADFGESIEGGGFIGVSYVSSPSLILGVGIGLSTSLEDEVRVLPIPFIRWQIDEQWLLTSDRTANLGGIALTYQATDTLRIGGLVGFDTNSFRLGEDANVPNGVGRQSFIPVALLVTWDATPQLSITAAAGVAFGQEYTLDNAEGDPIIKDDAESAGVFSLSATLRF